MNGRQRILTALERGQPDVVPIWEQAFINALATAAMPAITEIEAYRFNPVPGSRYMELVLNRSDGE